MLTLIMKEKKERILKKKVAQQNLTGICRKIVPIIGCHVQQRKRAVLGDGLGYISFIIIVNIKAFNE